MITSALFVSIVVAILLQASTAFLRPSAPVARSLTFSKNDLHTKFDGKRQKSSSQFVASIASDDVTETPPYLASENVTLNFPSYNELMSCEYGEWFTSKSFQCGNSTFCVKLFPRGGGTGSNRQAKNQPSSQQGFGMAYKILPVFGENDTKNQRLGIYLQYLGDESVDATFSLRLKGNQRDSRKFDVEWKGGMRFVSEEAGTKLAVGEANDFGAHLMQTPLLQEFMGFSGTRFDEDEPLTAMVDIIIHDTDLEIQEQESRVSESDIEPKKISLEMLGRDIRTVDNVADTRKLHNGEQVRVGKIVVPLCSKLSQRDKMFAIGAYPGVEYRILRILDQSGNERFTSCPGCKYEMRPIYPLVDQLERPWPVQVTESDIPRLYTPNMYNVVSAVGSLFTALTGLITAFLLSQAISLFFIPSRSMDPTLEVGDVLLVEKVTPRLVRNRNLGDIVLFSPPEDLKKIVAANGGKLTSRDLFVKRIVAQNGDRVIVDPSGDVRVNDYPAIGRHDLCEAEPLRLIERYIKPGEVNLAKDDFFLMGDCSSVSIDSRVWGPLSSSGIVGRPVLRIWPLEKFGTLPQLQPLSTTETWTDK